MPKKNNFTIIFGFIFLMIMVMVSLGYDYGFEKKVHEIEQNCEEMNGTIGGVFTSKSNNSHYKCWDIPIHNFEVDANKISFTPEENAKIIIDDCEKNHGKVHVTLNPDISYDITYNIECTNRVF